LGRVAAEAEPPELPGSAGRAGATAAFSPPVRLTIGRSLNPCVESTSNRMKATTAAAIKAAPETAPAR
jgi:hypothetical protein